MTGLYVLTALILCAALAAAGRLCGRILRRNAGGHALLRLLWAVLCGLALFFALESGIARRIAADLFLPVRNGQPLPWRALRLGLCLCAALAAETRCGGARARVRALLQKDRYCWLAAAAVTALFFLWAWRVTVFAFMTNDDTRIMRAFGDGTFWSLTAAYSHPMLGVVMHWLYTKAPGAYWYAGYHLAVQAAAMTVLGRCLYLKLRRRSWPPEAGLLLHALTGAGVFLCTLSELSFTVTPAAAGAAAVALLLCQDETEGLPSHALTGLASAALMFLCRLQRSATATALLCFWALAAGYRLLTIAACKRPRRLMRTGTLLAAAALTAGLLWTADNVQLSPSGDAAQSIAAQTQPVDGYSYSQAEYYRSRVMDYLLSRLSDEQLEAAGIPPELSALLRGWYFMDQRISTDTFRTIAEMYPDPSALPPQSAADTAGAADTADASAEAAAASAAAPAAPQSAPARLLAALRSMLLASVADERDGRVHTMLLLTCAMALLAALLLLRLPRYGLRGWAETLCGLCAGGGCMLMFLQLIRNGRFPLRTFLVAAVPAVTVMLLMAADAPDRPARTRLQKTAAGLSGALTAGLCVLALVTAASLPYTAEAADRRTVFADQNAVESYAGARPDMTFVTNALSNDLDPFHDACGYPSNLVRWGDTGVTASADRLYAEDFFRDDVQFLCHYPSTMLMLLQYLTLDHGPVQARVQAQLTSTFFAADLDRISPGGDYTGWYEQNGMTYYFRDGKALTGEQTIDGETYTFAPAGAQAQFSAAPGPEGALYFTDAYSLISEE